MNIEKLQIRETSSSGLDTGRQRSANQDYVASANIGYSTSATDEPISLYVVADGMGGHEAGELASQTATEAAVEAFEALASHQEGEPSPSNWLKQAASAANEAVYELAEKRNLDMGTTLVMAAVVDNQIDIVNIGDSRAYLIAPDAIQQITHDHSFAQAMADEGAIEPDAVRDHPQKNILTKAIAREQSVSADHFSVSIDSETYLLLCSDGLWDMVDDARIHEIVAKAGSSQAACDALVQEANDAGGKDNIAVVVAHLRP